MEHEKLVDNNADTYRSTLGPSLTPYNELKVANKIQQLRFTPGHEKKTELRAEYTESNGGSVVNNTGYWTLSTAAQADSVAEIMLNERLKYEPATEGELGQGMILDEVPTGDQKVIFGMYTDNNNGFNWLYDSEGLNVQRRKGGSVEDTINQSDFNVDKLNGTSADEGNPSGIDINEADGHVFYIRFVLYKVGFIEFGVAFRDERGGQVIYPAHRIFAPGETLVNEENIQPRVRVENGSTASSLSVKHTDMQGGVWGNAEKNARVSGETTFNKSAGGGDWVPLVAYKRESGAKNVDVRLRDFYISGDDDLKYNIFVGGELDSASKDFQPAEESSPSETVLEWDTSATSFTTIGEPVFPGALDSSNARNKELTEALDFNLPNGDIVVFAAKQPNSNQLNVTASLRANEGF